MGVLDKWVTNKLIKNKEVLYQIMDYRFNQGLIDQFNQSNPENIFTRTLLENNKWNSGIVEELEWFYKNTYSKLIGYNTSPVISYFWHKVTPKTIRIHSGVPGLISKTMINLIAGAGLNYSVMDENGNMDEEQTQRLQAILDDNKFEERLLPEGVNAESYGGFFAFKISNDPDVSEYPIIEVVPPENIEVIIKRGRIVGYKYKTNYKANKKDYERHEMYLSQDGGTLITYKLFEYVKAELREVSFSGEDVEKYQDVFINVPLASVFKNNTPTNTQFKGAYYGVSDYNNSQSIFNALDEDLSQMLTAIRFNRPKRFLSEDLLTNVMNGKKMEFNDFETDYEVVASDPDTESNKYQQFDNKMDITVYIESFKQLLVQALNNAGLSPASVGVTGLEALNASEGSQREKEKTTLRTREMKLSLWRPALRELFVKLLQFDDVANKGQQAGNYEVSIAFNDFSIPSLEQRIETANKALNGGLVDIRKAVDMIFLDDLSEEEKIQMVLNIKTENGVPLTVEDAVATQE